MKVELEIEEAQEVFRAVLDRIVGEAGLSGEDAAALRKWRTAMTPGSAGMRELATKLNADLARALENKKRSAVVKPDWR